MKRLIRSRKVQFVGFILLFLLAATVWAQKAGDEVKRIPFGAETILEGVIVERSDEVLTIQHYPQGASRVVLTSMTNIEERKRNFFRRSKRYSSEQLLLGLKVEVSGHGDRDGALVAEEIKFTQDDLEIAKTITSRVSPLESGLEQTSMRLEQARARLSETEQKLDTTTQIMEGEIEELDSAFRSVRVDARRAQATADQALVEVEDLDNRVSSLDDYKEVSSLQIRFHFDSAELPVDATQQLDQMAEKYKNQKGFLFQVVGFASADGNEDYNRRLSQLRAEAVVKYLTELSEIPLRRIISPYGFGENKPVADNATLAGRRENRRVEVKVLVNQGLAEDATS